MTVIAWQAGLAEGAFIGGTTIQGLLVQNHPTYEFQRWHGTLLFYAIIAFALFVNTYLGRILPKIEAIVFIVHILGFFIVLIPLVYFGPHASPGEVFANLSDSGGWGTRGLSFFVGLTASMLTFTGKRSVVGDRLTANVSVGIDAAAHMGKSLLLTILLTNLGPADLVGVQSRGD